MSQTDLLIVVFTLGILAFGYSIWFISNRILCTIFHRLTRMYELGWYSPKFMVLLLDVGRFLQIIFALNLAHRPLLHDVTTQTRNIWKLWASSWKIDVCEDAHSNDVM